MRPTTRAPARAASAGLRTPYGALLLLVATGGFAVATGLAACADDAELGAPASFDAGPPDNRVEPLDGGDVGDAAPEPAPSCATYCDLVADACSDANAQYTSREECLGFCAVTPAGERADRTQNTVGCRAYQAGIPAKTEPAANCPAAGPFGNGVCGDRCTTFCQLAFALCAGGSGPPFASVPDCVTACTGYPYVTEPSTTGDGGSDAGDAAAGDGGRDTLNCRLELLRQVRVDASTCAQLGSPSTYCR